MTGKRIRPDGTLTTTTAEWDAKWYWPVGTAVTVGQESGIVVKQNVTTADVQLESGRLLRRLRFTAMTRIVGTR
jgi:hypothetical protein